MNLKELPAVRSLPDDITVVIEIPAESGSVKYEVDKDSGALLVDRFMPTAMHYPMNYGFIPNTLADDGDPVDVLVHTPTPLVPGSVIRARVIGVLKMTDESGEDAKIIAVPTKKVCPKLGNIETLADLPPLLQESTQHFFERYKDLEPNKWVKISGWGDIEEAAKIIKQSMNL